MKEHWEYDLAPKAAGDVIGFLDEAGIETGVLLSVAYMYSRPGAKAANEYDKVRRENNYIARQVAKYPDRLVGMFSVNPLSDYAIKEIERCAEKTHLTGLKLQFGNSKVDLRDSTHVNRLGEIFAAARDNDLPIVVHLWTENPDYGRQDAQIFIREILPEAGDVPVQVAHMAGAGMFSETTVSAMKAFETALANGDPALEDVYFDLGAVTANPDAALAEGDSSRAKKYRTTHRRTARWIQRIGPERVVFGSDYFARRVPDYVETLRELPIPDSTLREVFDNRVP